MWYLYHCWKLHDKFPDETNAKGYGTKLIVSAFLEKEIEELNEQNKDGGES